MDQLCAQFSFERNNQHMAHAHERNNQAIQKLLQIMMILLNNINQIFRDQKYCIHLFKQRKISQKDFELQQKRICKSNLWKKLLQKQSIMRKLNNHIYFRQIRQYIYISKLRKDLEDSNNKILELEQEYLKIKEERSVQYVQLQKLKRDLREATKNLIYNGEQLKQREIKEQVHLKEIDQLKLSKMKLTEDLININKQVQIYSAKLESIIGQDELRRFILSQKWPPPNYKAQDLHLIRLDRPQSSTNTDLRVSNQNNNQCQNTFPQPQNQNGMLRLPRLSETSELLQNIGQQILSNQ